MLTLRRFKIAAGLAILVVASVFFATSNAYSDSDTGHDYGVSWFIHVGQLSWNQTDTYSWHEVFANNTGDRLIKVSWGWWHTLVDTTEGREVRWDKVSDTVDLRPSNTIDKSGWLNLNISSVRRGHKYQIKGETYVRIHSPRSDWGPDQRYEVREWSTVFTKE